MLQSVLLAITVAIVPSSAAATPHAEQSPPLIWAYVSPPIREGFVDVAGGALDSVKDVKNRLMDQNVPIARSQADADVVVVILARGQGPAEFGSFSAAMPVGNVFQGFSIPIPAKAYWVSAELQVGTYRKPLVGTSSDWESFGPWGSCAKAIAKDVKAWIKANHETLVQRQQERKK
jgi:hypothetical protein